MDSSRKGQMEFAWIFAVIVGAMILFLAFYFVGTKLIGQRYEQATIEAHSLDVLLNPFSSFGEIKILSKDEIALPQRSTLSIACNSQSNQGFGYNEITLTQKGQAGIPRNTYEKYIFAEQSLDSKEFQVLSAPFGMPWRVADLIILWPYNQSYCFVSAPPFISENLGNSSSTGLNISSIHFTTNKNSCPLNSITVCFPGTGCNISVTIQSQSSLGHKGSTTKRGSTLYFIGDALMYASIFSDKTLYNCNLQRLMARLAGQTAVYKSKATSLAGKGCSSTFNLEAIETGADALAKASSISESKVTEIWQDAQNIEQQNEIADCSLY
ncbi:MAG: hypothetical protein ACPLXC_01765 [Candidatus Pacearchaeota archaeon]